MEKDKQVLFERYVTIIENLTDTARMIARVEEEKAVAVSHKRHGLLEGFIKREQAYILKLRGQDQHRRRLSETLGWESLTFSQILEKSDPEQQKCLKPLFAELEQQLRRLQQSKELARQIMNVRVYELLAAMKREEGVPYDHSRNVTLDGGSDPKLCDIHV